VKPTIIGIGRSAPPVALGQEEALRLAEQCCAESAEEVDRLRRLFHRSGVRTRRFVVARRPSDPSETRDAPGGADGVGHVPEAAVPFFLPRVSGEDRGPTTAQRLAVYDEWAASLAHEAAAAALASADCRPDHVTHLFTVSCTGLRAPGVDVAIMASLGLPREVRRAHVGFMGCHGAINALRLACDACLADPEALALVACVELCSVHFQYRGEGDRLLANALFGDGSAAAVVSCRRASGRDDPALGHFASFVAPESLECMTWCVGDHGFEMSLSPDVPDRIRGMLRPWIGEWLGGRGLGIDQMGSWAVHPGGPRILDALAEALRLDRGALDVSREVLSRFGNMSSPTVLFILDELLRRGAPRPIAAIAFGPGLTIEAALVG